MQTYSTNCSVSTLRDIISDNSIIKREQESSGDVLITGSGCSGALRVAIFPASLPRFTPAFSCFSFYSVLFIPACVLILCVHIVCLFFLCWVYLLLAERCFPKWWWSSSSSSHWHSPIQTEWWGHSRCLYLQMKTFSFLLLLYIIFFSLRKHIHSFSYFTQSAGNFCPGDDAPLHPGCTLPLSQVSNRGQEGADFL